MPNFQPVAQLNTNLGWWFYKGYYKGGLDWYKLKDETNAAYFKKANAVLTNARLAEVPNVCGNYTPQYKTAYPGLVMGVGYQHETGALGEAKIGFYFDYTTGMPCLAGSSVKGILRSAFPQFKALEGNLLLPDSENTNKNKHNQHDNIKIAQAKAEYIASVLGWAKDDKDLFRDVYQLELAIFAGVDFVGDAEKKKSTDTALEYVSIYKRDIFHDAFPIPATDGKLLGEDFITPHVGGAKDEAAIMKKSLKNPIPILFFKIMPNVAFRFDFKVCENDIVMGDKSVTAKQRQDLYAQIIMDFGVGAKTNVGYGQFQIIETVHPTNRNPIAVGAASDTPPPTTKTPVVIAPVFVHKGPLNPNKRYELEAIVTKTGTPNVISVYVEEGNIQENIRLDGTRNPIDVGKVIKVLVTGNKNKVSQASFKGEKL